MSKEYKEKPKYIQVLIAGDPKLGIMVWDFPHTHTFYPSHFGENNLDDAIAEVIANGYELVSHTERRYIFKSNPKI